jgi:hypothetical protein
MSDLAYYIFMAWHCLTLEYKFHPGQDTIQSAYDSVKNKLFVANCARRFGKTYWIAVIAIKVALSKDLARVKIASAYLKDVEEYIIPTFDLVLEDCPDELKPQYLDSKKKYRFKNGSEIQIVGLDKNPNAGRGNYCDLYVFDEAAFIKNLSYIYSSIVMPMTMYREGAKVIMISTPPKTPDADFVDFIHKAKREDAYVELDIYKNPMVTPEMAEEYRRECLTETDWEREYLCKIVTDKTLALIPEAATKDFVVETKKDSNFIHFHKYVSMDLGVRDLNVTLFAYYDFSRAKLVIQREHVMNGPDMTTPKLHAAISAIEQELWDGKEPYKRVADNNNPLLLLDLGSIHNMFFHSTSKDNLHAMVNAVRVWISQDRIEIDPSCRFLIDSIKFGIWNDNRSEFARSKTLGHYDAVASLMYLVRNIDEQTNPIPKVYNFDEFVIEDDTQINEFKKLIPFRKG